jgi:hypothetical protein
MSFLAEAVLCSLHEPTKLCLSKDASACKPHGYPTLTATGSSGSTGGDWLYKMVRLSLPQQAMIRWKPAPTIFRYSK